MKDVPFGIYVHWPFCERKCPYCDFNSHVRAAVDESGWLGAALAELTALAAWQGGERPVVSTIFFGGGTPSLMQAGAVSEIIDGIARLWPVAEDVEITLEANPASVEADRFRGYRTAGVNRLSLGIQSLDDDALKFLGRLHSAAEATAALSAAQRTFPRVSIDLIYARPGQSTDAWRRELKDALSFGTRHLSLYQLTIEPATPFAALHRRGDLKTPDDELSAALYETTQELCEAEGLPAYEISNHARPGHEARHNLLYWRYGSYAGIGPGAHGRLTRAGRVLATMNEKLPERWAEKVRESGSGRVEEILLEPAEAAREHLLMNFRLREGIDVAAYEKRWGITIDRARIAALASDDLVTYSGGILVATPRGRLVLNALIAALADGRTRP